MRTKGKGRELALEVAREWLDRDICDDSGATESLADLLLAYGKAER